jgi:hypothetical protein
MVIKYDKEFEVTEAQYNIIMNNLAGVCAGLKRENKFFLKCWLMSYKSEVQEVLNKY